MITSEPQIGRFRTAPNERRSVSFVWSGDTAGQGWGIDEARGGMRTYSTMLRNRPDFFIHSGDHIYADCPIRAEQKLPNGELWRNIATEDKSDVARTLAEFRGNYKYNLLDRNVLAFNADVPMFAQWDDHEVTNDWCPGEPPRRGAYRDTSILQLTARGARAFHEFMPMRETQAEAGRVYRRISYGPLLDVFMLDMRTYRQPNSTRRRARRHSRRDAARLAQARADALAGHLEGDRRRPADRRGERRRRGARRRARRRAANARSPICSRSSSTRACATRCGSPPTCTTPPRTTTIPTARCSRTSSRSGSSSPGRCMPAPGTRSRSTTRSARAPSIRRAAAQDQPDNLAPCFGLQFFGHVEIDGETEVMTVTLKDVADQDLWSVKIEPQMAKWSGRAPRCAASRHCEPKAKQSGRLAAEQTGLLRRWRSSQ